MYNPSIERLTVRVVPEELFSDQLNELGGLPPEISEYAFKSGHILNEQARAAYNDYRKRPYYANSSDHDIVAQLWHEFPPGTPLTHRAFHRRSNSWIWGAMSQERRTYFWGERTKEERDILVRITSLEWHPERIAILEQYNFELLERPFDYRTQVQVVVPSFIRLAALLLM